MTSYSSDEFYRDWRYSVEKEFTSPLGSPVQYAQAGFRTWGGEDHKLPFSRSPGGAAVSSDGRLIAISVKEEIYVYDTTNFEQVNVCRGHVADVGSLAFQPGNSNVLVSSAENHHARSRDTEPVTIVWDLEEQRRSPMLEETAILDIAKQGTEMVVQKLLVAQPQLGLSTAEEETITTAIDSEISRIIKTHKVANERTLNGSLMSHFKSEIFSPSGSHMIYLPGKRPRSNRNDIWDVRIYSMTSHEDVLNLTGHTDALMWSSYSPDESLIGTVAWDQSMRIWDAQSGEQKYKFSTSNQNWIGGFSPDSQKFAGTCGDGSLYIYSLSDGSQLVHYKSTEKYGWMRALSWAPDCKAVVVGQGHSPGRIFLYDVEKKEVIQERLLSADACQVEPEYRKIIAWWMECNFVQFVDGGRKIVAHTQADDGIETYDLKSGEKWRFVRPGIDPEFEREAEGKMEKGGDKGSDDKGDVAKRGTSSMTVWEDHISRKIWIASIDFDAVRIWGVPMTKEIESELETTARE